MFDEAGRIVPTLETLAASTLLKGSAEVVLVDDGSTDGTPTVARETAEALGLDMQVIEIGQNRGKGYAVRAGMLAATGAVRVFVDADLSVTLDDIERCFEVIESGDADVAYGTRAHPDSALVRSQPAYRVASGRTFNFLLRTLGLTTDRDTQCGLKGFRATCVDEIFVPLVTERFAFDVEALARADRAGLRVVAVPVAWKHVEASRVRALRDGLDMARAAVRIRWQLQREARRATRTRPLAPLEESATSDLTT
jgi:dolichyl-phosphate beta-glucosyltransferase